MNMAHRLTARDLIAKSFSAKARRGYDPAEVDAYLMDVARQVDELNLEIDRLTNEVVRLSFTQPQAAAAPPPAPAPIEAPAAMAAEPSVSQADADESFKLILRAAQKTAEQALSDARARGEEIVAEAKFRAAEINREADRKAFEAASRTQEDLVRLEDEVKRRRLELDSVRRAIESEKVAVRDLATSLLEAIGEQPAAAMNGATGNVVDLTAAAAAPVPAPEPAAVAATGVTPPPPPPARPAGPPANFELFKPFGDES